MLGRNDQIWSRDPVANISILMPLALIVNRLISGGCISSGCIGGGCIGSSWGMLGLVPKPVARGVHCGLNQMEPVLLTRIMLIWGNNSEILRLLVDLMIVAKLAYFYLLSFYVHYWHFVSAPEVNLTCRSFVLLSHRDFLSVSQSVSLASCPQ